MLNHGKTRVSWSEMWGLQAQQVTGIELITYDLMV